MKITAAVLREKSGRFSIEELALEEPREDEVMVRIAGCGLCHTDLSARQQLIPSPLPIVLGHEGSGVVEKVGARVAKVKPGDHVVLTALSCGSCPSCSRGKTDLCTATFDLNFFGKRPDGSVTLANDTGKVHGCFFGQSSFATYAIANERNTVKVTKEVPIELLGPMGCGLRTGAGGVIHALEAKAGATIAVFGTGAVGMSAILAAVVSGCSKIIAVDILAERLAMADELGATHCFNGADSDPVARIVQATGGGVDYALDCTGNPGVIRQAVDALAIGGVCGLIGAPPMGTDAHLDVCHMLLGRKVIGIMGGDAVSDRFIPQLIDLYMQGRFPFDRMIRFYDLAQINEAIEDTEKGKTVKAILRP